MDQPTIFKINAEDLRKMTLDINPSIYIEKEGPQRGQFDTPTLELFPVVSAEIHKVENDEYILILRS